ncbi:M14 family zinc carboxypeptidase [Bacillus sp. DTU_2020_1000418_1_SI_GHA_SEK_038]|uniref:M14 family metallopeptidase n=1 Tax=Bacillus sp. DTU_2020_1000418_1_SI_GHA_SEK_038 TaxID=3077585 RepID=UPI0028EA5B85|nr:M14 family zinc carboxypeptidase [Bacillus sp. DTU_2020_1000418_1_SI_GHA_SEK_038]WNS74291.1 M14 family zinc carboxypeptidase [Bacillus sp. DTU_2020_1000418_1_SI_GHA_SEK_038]
MKVKVRAGDTLWYYSRLFMVPLNLLIDSNPSVNPNSLNVGQEIQIPGFKAVSYKIKIGDTYWKLSKARHLSVDALLLLNPKTNPNQLQAGETILIPSRVITPVANGKRNYNFEALSEDIQSLQSIYPFIKVNTIGNTVLGKPIQEIRLGRGRKKVHFNASFHANEWITSGIIMSLLNHFLLSLTNVKPIRGLQTMPLYESVDLSIVPMVNADGVNLVINGPTEDVRERVIGINRGSTDFSGWKANIRGVDLNDQYPAKWETEKDRSPEKSPAPRDYPGTAPLTEPEAIAMAELTRSRQFNRVLAFHTQGEEFYWGYEGMEPPESSVLAREFARVSGYRSVQYIESYAGYKDWFIKEFRRPGFTVELGKGINPLPLSQFDEIFEEVLGIYLAALYM